MADPGWYDVVEGPELLQGDVLRSCDVYLPLVVGDSPVTARNAVTIRIQSLDLVVLTQSCDLANDKVGEVLLCRLMAWPEVVRAEVQRGNLVVRSSKFRKALIEGAVPGLSLLPKREEEPRLDWSVLDFRALYTLPKELLGRFAAEAGARLRLRSPYREHLAQALARYFMRVGLPQDLRAFEKEGDVLPQG